MSNTKEKIQKAFISVSILTVLTTIWLFFIIMLQFIHPVQPEFASFNEFDDFDTMLLKMLEEESEKEEGKIKTILMQPRDASNGGEQRQQQQPLKVNIDLWAPEVLRLNVANDTLDIKINAVEQHFEVLQNKNEIKIITNLNQCKTFDVTNYVMNDIIIVWRGVSANAVSWFSSVIGNQETLKFDNHISELLELVGETMLVWRSTENRIMMTNLIDNSTRDLMMSIDAKPKAVEMFGDVLYILNSEKLTVCNTVSGAFRQIEVVADVILSPTLVLKLLSATTRSMLLELVNNTNFVESSTNCNIDTDNIDDLYVLRQGHRVVICDGRRGTVQILGSGHKHYLPLKNLKIKHVVTLGREDFRIFLSSNTAVYILRIIGGEVVDVVTRSDLREISDINRSFIVRKLSEDDANFECIILPSNLAHLRAKLTK
jgi:hypothetical protein